MPEVRTLLERESRTVDLAPGGFDRLMRRHDRRRRNHRIGSALLAIAIATATIGYAIEVFHRGAERVPLDRITSRNIDHLGVSWSLSSFNSGTDGGWLIRDGIVYTDTGSGAHATVEGYALDCLPVDGACTAEWAAPPLMASGHARILVGSRFVYVGGGSSVELGQGQFGSIVTAISRECSARICPDAWRSEPVAGAQSATPVAEDDDRLYVSLDPIGTLEAFAPSCGQQTCDPIWSATRVGLPARVDDVVVARTKTSVAAFDSECWNARGPACRPIWSGRMRPTADPGGVLPMPVVLDGHVLVNDAAGLESFALDCEGTCGPEWVATVPEGPGFAPVVDHGMVFTAAADGTDLYAFPVDCATGGKTCKPAWTGRTEDGVGFAPLVADEQVLVATTLGSTLSAFPIRCARTCEPSWVAQLDDSIVYPPVVSSGLIYVSGIEAMTVFTTACANPCPGIFRWDVPSGNPQAPVFVSDDTVLISANNDTVFALRLGGTPEIRDASPPPLQFRSAVIPLMASIVLLIPVWVAWRRRRRFP
jgi:outer membrane protein assembly factor BamB